MLLLLLVGNLSAEGFESQTELRVRIRLQLEHLSSNRHSAQRDRIIRVYPPKWVRGNPLSEFRFQIRESSAKKQRTSLLLRRFRGSPLSSVVVAVRVSVTAVDIERRDLVVPAQC